jgi:hypothetical protein
MTVTPLVPAIQTFCSLSKATPAQLFPQAEKP